MALCWRRSSLPLSLFLLGGSAYQASAASVALGEDNNRDRWRYDEAKFADQWDPPTLLPDATTGNLNGGRVTDLDVAPFALPFEKAFFGPDWTRMTRACYWIGHATAVLYLIGMWAGEKAMKDLKPFDLKAPLNLWNLFLAVYSLCGAIRTVPHLLASISTYGVDYTLCRAAAAAYGSGPVGLWVMLFIYSKYFELIDTVFLVLRKKKVMFLHWYHHFTVLLYCWHSYVWEMPTGLYFTAMNYSVHAIMYFYYFLAGMGKPPNWGLFVTIIQIAQMVVGIAVTVGHMVLLYRESVPHCDGYLINLGLALAMYGSYCALFVQFFVEKYCRRSKKAKTNGTNGHANGTNGHANGVTNGENGASKKTN
eukprot:TRINITY_DN101463_c0_g1_i1.p1 TRINITY_DN101463_c0_g1~~TRINITY_DN101463_c0_g1_i1.p1  ORF type:complete len:394 (+),score=75.31 TRINITY_DN101463_c0_g1_i1:89-1183(+)